MLEVRNGWSRGISSSFPADAETVVQMRRVVCELARRAGGAPDRVAAVRLAVSEAATNAVLHAYHGHRDGTIYLTASVVDGELSVVIADDGCGLGGQSPTPGLGWGWKLIADACDALTIAQREGGGTEMRMSFRLREDALDDYPAPMLAGSDDNEAAVSA